MKGCPECKTRRICRSRRRGFAERILLTMVFVRPFRCVKCDARFFRWSPLGEVPTSVQNEASNISHALSMSFRAK